MAFLWFLFFNTLCHLSITNSELIDSLPGQPPDVMTFKQYSGYIVTDDYHGRAIFYYFVEAQSENKLSMPLTLWLGGGVLGCSCAAVGVFYEHGPFKPGEDGNLIKNEFSWNLVSNMLYIDSPIGSSFSYSNTSSDYTNWNDASTAKENMLFLLKWYKEFPEYSYLDLYIAGDGYGGHFVPQLAALVLEYNRIPVYKRPIKLKGIALGNPLLDFDISLDKSDNLWYHGIISEELHHLQKTCNSTTLLHLEVKKGNFSEDCSKVDSMTRKELGDGFVMGDMLLPSCIYSKPMSAGEHYYLASQTSNADPCLRDRIDAYLNMPQVQKALHANTTGLPDLWSSYCDGSTGDDFELNMLPILSALLKWNIPVLIYSGDQDLIIPVTQTRILATTLARNSKLITSQRNGPWYNGIQIGGWSQSFGKMRQDKMVTYLTFATVKGGAHYVPFSSPSQALTLFKAFLKGSSPPRTY